MVNHNVTTPIIKAARELLLFRLLIAGPSPSKTMETLQIHYNQMFPHKRLIVAVLRFKVTDTQSNELKKEDACLERLSKLMLWLTRQIREFFICEGVICGDNLAAILINDELWGNSQINTLNQLLNKEMEYSTNQLWRGTKPCIGIGSVIEAAEELNISYCQGLAATDYYDTLGGRAVIEYDEIEDLEKQEGVYPLETESFLLHAIRHGHKERAEQLLEHFMDELAGRSVREAHLNILQLRFAIRRLPMPEEAEGGGTLSLLSMDRELNTTDRLHQKSRILGNEIEKRVSYKNREEQQRRAEIAQAATTHIEENYGSFELSVESVAEYVGFSAGYIRKLFKDVYGCSPTEYIFNLRLDKAKELLRETNETAKMIAEKVGYGNTKYFYITFKKNVGLTTYEYREREKQAVDGEPSS